MSSALWPLPGGVAGPGRHDPVPAAAVNDVSGGLADPRMAPLVAEAGVPHIAMDWRVPSAVMHRHTDYGDVVEDVVDELRRRLDALVGAGIDHRRVVLDPGLGFAKLPGHNWQLLARLHALSELGRPILVGASRTSFLGDALSAAGQIPPRGRDAASAAISALAAAAGAYCVRVHDVRSSVHAVLVASQWVGAARPAVGSALLSRG